MLDTISGKVKSFNPVENRRFGFIHINGEDIFFHQNYGRRYSDAYSYEPETRYPKPGDLLVFEPEETPKGLRAKWWAFETPFVEAQSIIKQYCLIERTGSLSIGAKYHELAPKTRVLWEGKDLVELRNKFPKRDYPIHKQNLHELYFKCEGIRCEDPR